MLAVIFLSTGSISIVTLRPTMNAYHSRAVASAVVQFSDTDSVEKEQSASAAIAAGELASTTPIAFVVLSQRSPCSLLSPEPAQRETSFVPSLAPSVAFEAACALVDDARHQEENRAMNGVCPDTVVAF